MLVCVWGNRYVQQLIPSEMERMERGKKLAIFIVVPGDIRCLRHHYPLPVFVRSDGDYHQAVRSRDVANAPLRKATRTDLNCIVTLVVFCWKYNSHISSSPVGFAVVVIKITAMVTSEKKTVLETIMEILDSFNTKKILSKLCATFLLLWPVSLPDHSSPTL